MKKESDKKTIEELLDEVEDVVAELEDEDTQLEASFAIYEKGIKLIKEVNSRIDKVEKKMVVLTDDTEEEE